MQELTTEVLVVGGGTGGTAAAIQAARRGAQTILVSEGPWLGGMLTSAGVSVPDGNELVAFQTGIWGQFLRELSQRQPEGLDHSWVSCFAYDPQIGAEIFADWVAALPSLTWIRGQKAIALSLSSQPPNPRTPEPPITVQFPDYQITSQILLDGTELGNLLELGQIPHRWGWEPQEQWQEPSAPTQVELETDPWFARYPVQSPTWVVVMQDYGPEAQAPLIPAPAFDVEPTFAGAWDRYGPEKFLNYGKLPGDRFMINWPIQGNDYGFGLERLRGSQLDWETWAKEAIAQSQGFAAYIQGHIGRRYGLATHCFPSQAIGGGAYGLQPYYREGRRLIGMTTVTEQDLLPVAGGFRAALPRDGSGQVSAIAIGNYPNDHHYPEREIQLAPKARRWGGRWTGTPFTIPFGALIPETVDGFLACEKNISVSHMANGATRLQPTVLGIGQAAGMAAALCIERHCQPRDLPMRVLQEALLGDRQAPSALIPLFNLPPDHPDWQTIQQHYLNHPDDYPLRAEHPVPEPASVLIPPITPSPHHPITPSPFFQHQDSLLQANATGYRLHHPDYPEGLPLITLRPEVEERMRLLQPGQKIAIAGQLNRSGPWVRVERLEML